MNINPQQMAALAAMMGGNTVGGGMQSPQAPQAPQIPRTPAAPSDTIRAMATGGMVKSGRSRGDGCITKGGTKGRIV